MVVFCTELDECLAGRGAGMRTVGLPPEEGDWVSEDLEGMADACLDEIGDSGPLALSIHDLTTPGSYWLNPCLARDADGNSVDPETGLPFVKGASSWGDADADTDGGSADDEDDELARQILRDMEA